MDKGFESHALRKEKHIKSSMNNVRETSAAGVDTSWTYKRRTAYWFVIYLPSDSQTDPL